MKGAQGPQDDPVLLTSKSDDDIWKLRVPCKNKPRLSMRRANMVQQVHPDIESLEAENPSSLDPQEDLGPWLLLLPVVGNRNPAVRDRRIQGLGFEVQHF